jgi:hypothetical protein
VGLTTLPCKKIEKPPRNSAIFNGRRLRRRPRPKLGCAAKEEEEEKKKNRISDANLFQKLIHRDYTLCGFTLLTHLLTYLRGLPNRMVTIHHFNIFAVISFLHQALQCRFQSM